MGPKGSLVGSYGAVCGWEVQLLGADVAVPPGEGVNYHTHKVVPSAQGGPSDAKLFEASTSIMDTQP